MGKRKIIRTIIFLIIISLVLQFLPISLNYTEYFKSYSSNSELLRARPNILNHCVLAIIKEAYLLLFHNVSINSDSTGCSTKITNCINLVNSNNLNLLFDNRYLIKPSILHYFNGSKYKQSICFLH